MLSEKEIQELKKKLEKEQNNLLAELKEVRKPMVSEMGDDVDHFDEEADEAESFIANQSLDQTFKERLENVKAALFKIEQGKYGFCEKCGHEVEYEVLKIDPETRFCKNCKIN